LLLLYLCRVKKWSRNNGGKLLQLRHMRRDSDPTAPTFVDLLQAKRDKNAVYESIVHSLPDRMQGIGGADSNPETVGET
jgi:hypothetical protein